MILGDLESCAAYAELLPGMRSALDYLRGWDPATPDGRHAIDGERVFALVSAYETGPATERRFEAHRAHVDVQWVAAGTERILHAPLPGLAVQTAYDEAGDIEFFADPAASSSLLLPAGGVAVFFPRDAHKPGCMAGGRHTVRKVVVKIRL